MNKETSPGVIVIAKLLVALLMAFLVTSYTMPYWLVVILFFIS